MFLSNFFINKYDLAFQQHHLNANILSHFKPSDSEENAEIEIIESEGSTSEVSEESKRRRTRTNFTQWQINELEKAFR